MEIDDLSKIITDLKKAVDIIKNIEKKTENTDWMFISKRLKVSISDIGFCIETLEMGLQADLELDKMYNSN